MFEKTLIVAALLSAGATPALAEDFEVQMLNRGADGEMMVFEPAYLQIEPGDTVTFVPTDPTHNAESILGMLPEGAEAFKGKINEEISVTFEEEGLYGYKCAPHFGLGMIGLIEVGESAPNAEEAQNVTMPPRAQERMALLFAEALSEAGETGEETAQ